MRIYIRTDGHHIQGAGVADSALHAFSQAMTDWQRIVDQAPPTDSAEACDETAGKDAADDYVALDLDEELRSFVLCES